MKTMKSDHKRQPCATLGRFGLALGLLALAGGCQSMEHADHWIDKQMDVPTSVASAEKTATIVRRDTIRQAIGFAPRSAALDGAEHDMLARFISRSGAVQGDTATITLSPAGGRALALRRAAAIARALHRNGLSVARSFQPGDPDVAVVAITRVVAIPPKCPPWRDAVEKGRVDESYPELGCMTAASLATSVARPQDLVSGRPSGPSDAATLDRGLQSLREGKFDTTYSASGTGTSLSGTTGTTGAK
jgi:pilus biogenesis lipoprotein CpaD